MRICKCGNKSGRTYIPELTSYICCLDCFSPLPKKEESKVNISIKFKESEDSYIAVKITNGKEEILKEFNKYADDFAFTNCRDFINSYRIQHPAKDS